MPTDGQQMGCHDCAPPEVFTEEALSRGHDLMRAIRMFTPLIMAEGSEGAAHDEAEEMIDLVIPPRMRLEMAWNSWRYRAPR